ncbi:antirepressor protein [Lactococcus phage CHPC974]|nr:antirepressor protein [Lactococcus phage CHPC974]
MNELIKISSNENDEQVVSARELHKGLGLKKERKTHGTNT